MKDSEKLKRELEKSFFGVSFKNIKKNPIFLDLSLTDQEIIEYRNEIKQAIISLNNCGESKISCCSLEPHYLIKRNQDQQLILSSFKCHKQKDYENIPEESLNKKIQKALKDFPIQFTYSEVIGIIKHEDHKQLEYILENLGNPKYPLKNKYICTQDTQKKRSFYILQIFHAILLELKIEIIESQNLKNIYSKRDFLNEKLENMYTQNFNKLINADLLTILDLGCENNYRKGDYYLDWLPELLKNRFENKKATHILTMVDWSTIQQDLKDNNYYQKTYNSQKNLQKIKFESLNETIKSIFSQNSKTTQ